MSAPNPVYPDSTLFLTRRTHDGSFRFTPTEEILNIFKYLAIHYAQRDGIALTTLVLMSNHYHATGDDPLGRFPDFTRDLNSKFTEVLNHRQGRKGPMWANCKPYRPRLLDRETVLDKMLYAATNPVKHHVVHNSALWPGLIFSPENAGDTIEATCPAYLAREYNSYPAEVSMVVPIPRAYGNRPIREVREDFRRRRLRKDERLRKAYNGRYVGRDAALAMGPDHVVPPPPPAPNKSFDCHPDNLPAALAHLCAFRRRYTRARKIVLAGGRPTFPRGTYAMHRWHGFPRAP